jgi:RNase P/RNase MRP subunit p29
MWLVLNELFAETESVMIGIEGQIKKTKNTASTSSKTQIIQIINAGFAFKMQKLYNVYIRDEKY